MVERPWGEARVVLRSRIDDRLAYMVAVEDQIHLLHLTIFLECMLVLTSSPRGERLHQQAGMEVEAEGRMCFLIPSPLTP